MSALEMNDDDVSLTCMVMREAYRIFIIISTFLWIIPQIRTEVAPMRDCLIFFTNHWPCSEGGKIKKKNLQVPTKLSMNVASECHRSYNNSKVIPLNNSIIIFTTKVGIEVNLRLSRG